MSEGNITEREKKKKPTKYTPNHNSQGRSSPDACLRHQRAGDGQGGMGSNRVITKGELAGCGPAPPPARGKEAGGQQSEPEGKGQSWLQGRATSTKL